MNRYAIRYFDKGVNGWTRLCEAADLKEAVTIGRCDPEIVQIKEILQISNTHNTIDL